MFLKNIIPINHYVVQDIVIGNEYPNYNFNAVSPVCIINQPIVNPNLKYFVGRIVLIDINMAKVIDYDAGLRLVREEEIIAIAEVSVPEITTNNDDNVVHLKL